MEYTIRQSHSSFQAEHDCIVLGWCAAMCAKVSLVVPVNNFLITVLDLSLNMIPNFASKLVGVKAAWKFCKFYFFRNFVFRGIQIGQTEPPTQRVSALSLRCYVCRSRDRLQGFLARSFSRLIHVSWPSDR